jgi:hypothetical protein
MFLARYHFAGDPAELVSAYDRVMTHIPPDDVLVHLSAVDAAGLTIIDACPTYDAFVGFSTNADVLALFHACGLPTPEITPLGEVHSTYGVDANRASR